MIILIVISERGGYTHLTLRGSKLIDWYVSMARTRSSCTLATAETSELQLQAAGAEPFAPSPRAYTECLESKPPAPAAQAPGEDKEKEAGVLINSSLADGVAIGARAVVLNSVLVRGTRVGPNAFLNGIMCYDLGDGVGGAHSQAAGGTAGSSSESTKSSNTPNTNTSNTATSDRVIIPANVVLQGFWVHSEALGGAAPGHSRRTKAQAQSQVALPCDGEPRGVRVLAIWGCDDALDVQLPAEVDPASGDTARTADSFSFCGQLWSAFQQRTGIRDDDLWPESKVCKIHAIVRMSE